MRQLKRFFLFTMLLSHALTKPISPGENIWQVNAFSCEQSEETTSKICEIESKLDTIDLDSGNSIDSVTDILCSKLAELETCIPITAEDIGPFGFTISSPGKYCLTENIVCAGASPVIIISSNNVTLDLGDHTIDGDNIGRTGVCVNNANNVIVKNGKIIKGAHSGLVINDSTRVCITNIKSSLNNGHVRFDLRNSTHIIFDHCLAQSNYIGFNITNCSYCVFRDCIADNNSNDGFLMRAFGFPVVQQNNSNTFIRCQANSNTSTGFMAEANGGSIFDTILCKYIAISNTTGFNFDDAETLNSVLMSCKAIDNTTGFTGNSSTGTFNNFAKVNTTSYSGITTPISMIDSLDTDIGFWTNNDQ